MISPVSKQVRTVWFWLMEATRVKATSKSTMTTSWATSGTNTGTTKLKTWFARALSVVNELGAPRSPTWGPSIQCGWTRWNAKGTSFTWASARIPASASASSTLGLWGRSNVQVRFNNFWEVNPNYCKITWWRFCYISFPLPNPKPNLQYKPFTMKIQTL